MLNTKFYKDMAMYTMAGLTTVAIMKGAEIAYDKIKAAIEAKKNTSNVVDDSEEESDEDTFEFDVKEFEESEDSESSDDSDQEADEEIPDLTVEEYLDELMGILDDNCKNLPSKFTNKILRNLYKISVNKTFFTTGFEAATASRYFNENYDDGDIVAFMIVIDNHMHDFISAFSLHSSVSENDIFTLFNNRIKNAVKEMKEKKDNEEK